MKKIIYLLALVMVLLASSCEKLHDWNQPKEPETKFTSIEALGGEWWVQYYFDNGDGTYSNSGYGYFPLFTSNTAADDGKEMWISDAGSFWTYTIKCPVNVKSLTFEGDTLISTADLEGSLYDIWLNVTAGKVLKNAGLSPSGVVVDSIFVGIEFEDDPGTIYYAAGVRKTGFLEDEH
jgi:hypothetical protein